MKMNRNLKIDEFTSMIFSKKNEEEKLANFQKMLQSYAKSQGVEELDFTVEMLKSILDRLEKLVALRQDPYNDITKITQKSDKSRPNSIVTMKGINTYSYLPYGRKIDISFADVKDETYYLDLDTGDIIIKSFVKVGNDRSSIDTWKVGTYCFADKRSLDSYEFLTNKNKKISENSIDNIIVCDRFDTVDTRSFIRSRINKNDDRNHKNNIKEKMSGLVSEEEMELMIKYYTDEKDVPVPHFHVGHKVYEKTHFGTQLAISLGNLRIYLNDLAKAIKNSKTTNHQQQDENLTNIDIGLPFYVLKDCLLDLEKFMVNMNSIFQGLLISVHGKNKERIIDFYNKLNEMSKKRRFVSGGVALKIVEKSLGIVDDNKNTLSSDVMVNMISHIEDAVQQSIAQTQQLNHDLNNSDDMSSSK